MSRIQVVRREGIEGAQRKLVRETHDFWEKFPALRRFLQDHFASEWGEVKECGKRAMLYESQDRPGYFRLVPIRCQHSPLCPRCADHLTGRRVRKAFDRFHLCSPPNEKPRFIHIVQTAPLTDGGEGWGAQAANDLSGFSGVVWNALVELYGEGIGAMMSYHDMGERLFAKRHPHFDLTLNGWELHGDGMEKTARYELKAKGRERWDDTVARHAAKRWGDAQRGSVSLHAAVLGAPAYYRTLRYQMREIVDLRKLDYSHGKQMVYWLSYADNRREPFMVDAFLEGMNEYRARFGVWTKSKRNTLHRGKGHLADSQFKKVGERVGGRLPVHQERCTCARCEAWGVPTES